MEREKEQNEINELCERSGKMITLSRDEFQRVPFRDVQALIEALDRKVHELGSQVEQSLRTELECKNLIKRNTELFDFAPVGYFILNSRGSISDVNLTARQILGISREKMMNVPFDSFIKPQYHATFRSYLNAIFDTGRIASTEVEMQRGDNTVFDAQLQTLPWHEGPNITYRLSLADITDRKQAERALAQSEKRFRSTLDGMLEACVILDFNWRYLYVNDAAVRMSRRTKEQRIGRTIMEMFPDIEKQDAFVRLRKCMENRTQEKYETEFTFPEGNKAWFEVRCDPVPEGIFILYLDITERKINEKRLGRELDQP